MKRPKVASHIVSKEVHVKKNVSRFGMVFLSCPKATKIRRCSSHGNLRGIAGTNNIWGVPKMGVPPNHQFVTGFPLITNGNIPENNRMNQDQTTDQNQIPPLLLEDHGISSANAHSGVSSEPRLFIMAILPHLIDFAGEILIKFDMNSSHLSTQHQQILLIKHDKTIEIC